MAGEGIDEREGDEGQDGVEHRGEGEQCYYPSPPPGNSGQLVHAGRKLDVTFVIGQVAYTLHLGQVADVTIVQCNNYSDWITVVYRFSPGMIDLKKKYVYTTKEEAIAAGGVEEEEGSRCSKKRATPSLPTTPAVPYLTPVEIQHRRRLISNREVLRGVTNALAELVRNSLGKVASAKPGHPLPTLTFGDCIDAVLEDLNTYRKDSRQKLIARAQELKHLFHSAEEARLQNYMYRVQDPGKTTLVRNVSKVKPDCPDNFCYICPTYLSAPNKLLEHLRSSQHVVPLSDYQCSYLVDGEQCGKAFDEQWQANNHLKKDHNSTETSLIKFAAVGCSLNDSEKIALLKYGAPKNRKAAEQPFVDLMDNKEEDDEDRGKKVRRKQRRRMD